MTRLDTFSLMTKKKIVVRTSLVHLLLLSSHWTSLVSWRTQRVWYLSPLSEENHGPSTTSSRGMTPADGWVGLRVLFYTQRRPQDPMVRRESGNDSTFRLEWDVCGVPCCERRVQRQSISQVTVSYYIEGGSVTSKWKASPTTEYSLSFPWC